MHGDYMDEYDLAEKYKNKPEYIESIKNNARKYYCPVKQVWMYCDPRYSHRVQDVLEHGKSEKKEGCIWT